MAGKQYEEYDIYRILAELKQEHEQRDLGKLKKFCNLLNYLWL